MNQIVIGPEVSCEVSISNQDFRIITDGLIPLVSIASVPEVKEESVELGMTEEETQPWLQLARDTEDLRWLNSVKSTSALDVKRAVLRQRIKGNLRKLGILEPALE